MFAYRNDLYVPAAGMWLDPRRPRPFAFVSHAHGDHIGRHERILATPATARFMEHRLGKLTFQRVGFGETIDLGAATQARLHPAGHIQGAAQIEIVHRGERLVYTGDFRLRPSETADACAVVPCDVLIMECTFGRPEYLFPPRSEVIPRLAAHLSELLEQGRTPVLLAYALGRSQELLQVLAGRGFEFHLAPPVYAMVKIYEELGMTFENYRLAQQGQTQGGVLVVPPHASRSRLVKHAHQPLLIAATGWSAGGSPPYHADCCYPFSDHADFAELVEYVERARPREVHVINGYTEFRDHLRERGFRAYKANERMSLR